MMPSTASRPTGQLSAPIAPPRAIAAEVARDSAVGSTRLSALNPSLLMDLERFGASAGFRGGIDLVAVLAAAVRHNRPLRMLVQLEPRQDPVALTLYTPVRLAHCTMPMVSVLSGRLTDWRVLSIEPARFPSPQEGDRLSDPHLYSPMPQVLWALAMRGGRDTLLPEIGGVAAYRVTPAADLGHLDLTGTVSNAVQRLRRQTTNVREMARWPGFDRVRAHRLLNALYLQAALMVSRSHPAATNDGWVSTLF